MRKKPGFLEGGISLPVDGPHRRILLLQYTLRNWETRIDKDNPDSSSSRSRN